MNTIREIIESIQTAQDDWTGWGRRREFGRGDPNCPICEGRPFIYPCREAIPDKPMCKCEELAAECAREYAAKSKAAAIEVSEYGDKAISALQSGDIATAQAMLKRGVEITSPYLLAAPLSAPLRLMGGLPGVRVGATYQFPRVEFFRTLRRGAWYPYHTTDECGPADITFDLEVQIRPWLQACNYDVCFFWLGGRVQDENGTREIPGTSIEEVETEVINRLRKVVLPGEKDEACLLVTITCCRNENIVTEERVLYVN